GFGRARRRGVSPSVVLVTGGLTPRRSPLPEALVRPIGRPAHSPPFLHPPAVVHHPPWPSPPPTPRPAAPPSTCRPAAPGPSAAPGRGAMCPPSFPVEPITCPCLSPPPARHSDSTTGQWSRPSVLPCVPIFGVRPNSPIAITSTSSSVPRWRRSSTRVV